MLLHKKCDPNKKKKSHENATAMHIPKTELMLEFFLSKYLQKIPGQPVFYKVPL